jgi:GNAT superfamily N-acetyltransferase
MKASEGAAESSPELPELCAHDVLSNSDLFYVHFDERGRSATLGFSRVHGTEGFEFFLRFNDVRDVRVRGWGAPAQKDVHVERAARRHGPAVRLLRRIVAAVPCRRCRPVENTRFPRGVEQLSTAPVDGLLPTR